MLRISRAMYLCTAELRSLYDLMIFVNVDDDTRLARRVRRDITERGRDVLQVCPFFCVPCILVKLLLHQVLLHACREIHQCSERLLAL